mmetsp:Transcript_7462/g.17902  ORF Transcript_7462/g.17902 Transcript_7462/m.17902 type:complete len:91 (+) Transcript_7462:472-744(+)
MKTPKVPIHVVKLEKLTKQAGSRPLPFADTSSSSIVGKNVRKSRFMSLDKSNNTVHNLKRANGKMKKMKIDMVLINDSRRLKIIEQPFVG